MDDLSPEEVKSSVREVKLLKTLKHPNILSFKQAFLEETLKEQALCLVTEYVDGGNLGQLIKKQEKKNLWMNEADIWRFAISVVRGLRVIHEKKIIHRDIKSENLLIDSESMQLKICDMNVSAQGSIIGAASGQYGTPYFTAPEVWNNKVYS